MTFSRNRREFLGTAARAILASSAIAQGEINTAQQGFLFSKELPETQPYDVVICGGGPSGIGAALAARRAGLKTIVLEGQGQLGGMSTSGLVSHWLGGRQSDCEHWVVGGIFRELCYEGHEKQAALIAKPDLTKKYQPHGWFKGQLAAGIPIEPYRMASMLDEKFTAEGIDFLYFTPVIDVKTKDNIITHIIAYNKSGIMAIPARAVIDATGDGDIAARSGCDYVKGRAEDGVMADVTLEFHVDNVNQDALADYILKKDDPRFRKTAGKLAKEGKWPNPIPWLLTVQLTEKGVMMVNTSRIYGPDGTNGASVTQAMVKGRKETLDLIDGLRKLVPGFENARLKSVAPLLGVRETRRIKGETTLIIQDLFDGREYDDIVGFSAYGWDLPNSTRPPKNPQYGRDAHSITPIPYSIMVPTNIQNLICPGRMVSVERELLGPLRVMAPCFAMGQAAGIASSQVVKNNIAYKEVDTKLLRRELNKNKAIIDPEQINEAVV